MGKPDVLQSWKQISEYVGRTERTLQRWERDFGFPVRRPSGKSRSAVTALPQEIREWTRGRPSLTQIRSRARLSRAKLVDDKAKLTILLASKRQMQAVLESRVLLSSLLGEQKTLREKAATLRQQQHNLIRKLRGM